MRSLFSQDLLNGLSTQEQVRAQDICSAINQFIDDQGASLSAYPDLVSFVRGNLFEPYVQAHLANPRRIPFFQMAIEGAFIKDINFIHAYCASGGNLSAFANSELDTVDVVDVIGRAIYHGIHAVTAWFVHDTPLEARFKAISLLVSVLPRSIQTLEQDMYQYGGVCSPRPDLLWIAHDSLHHALYGELLPPDINPSQLTAAERHQLVVLGSHDDVLFEQALTKLHQVIAFKWDDAEVRRDHTQHVIALSIYDPVFLMINQGLPANAIASLVRARAPLVLRRHVRTEQMEATVNQVLYNALSISPDHLREVFGEGSSWVPEADAHPIFAKGPVLAFAGHNAVEIQASLEYFTAHYGSVVKRQLAQRVHHDAPLVEALIHAGHGHLQALDEVLETQSLSTQSSIKAIKAIGAHPGAWSHYQPTSVINLFEPILQLQGRNLMGAPYAPLFQGAMAAHHHFKTSVIEALANQVDISLVDLRFLGLVTSDIPGLTDRLRASDLESILQSELGL
ncbi:hypothetical protein [Pseudomonas sp. S1(2024)]|uniref:hypothetical protein n=1 Tax=Pseudomonas sp. S1(2024) TaxID=3390191 RepID=UPI00397D6EFD